MENKNETKLEIGPNLRSLCEQILQKNPELISEFICSNKGFKISKSVSEGETCFDIKIEKI